MRLAAGACRAYAHIERTVGKDPVAPLSHGGPDSFAVTDMDEKEYEHELFGPVIFSYTDAQAVEDGVLFDVTPYTLNRVNRVTNAVYEWLGGSDDQEQFAAKYRELEDQAIRAFDKSKDKELVEFSYKGRRVWMMDNETGGRTIMFPEDY